MNPSVGCCVCPLDLSISGQSFAWSTCRKTLVFLLFGGWNSLVLFIGKGIWFYGFRNIASLMQRSQKKKNVIEQFLLITEWIQETALWSLFLSRFGTRETKIRTPGVEYSLRIQWDRSKDQCAAAPHVPEPVWGTVNISARTSPFHALAYCNCWRGEQGLLINSALVEQTAGWSPTACLIVLYYNRKL